MPHMKPATPEASPSGAAPKTFVDPIPDHPRYQALSYINRGAHGVVVLARDKTSAGKHVALKFMPREKAASKYVEREILNHFKLRHPHVIRLDEVFLTSSYLVLVLEYADGGDLHTYFTKHGACTEQNARWFFQQLILAMDFCHRMGVANRDIKLENLLLVNNSWALPLLKLADFGFSKDEDMQSAPSSRVGTAMYIAPEVIMNSKREEYDAKKADMWSCGVVLFQMMTGQFPFRRPEDAKLGPTRQLATAIPRILKADYTVPDFLSDNAKDLLHGLLQVDPKNRLDVGQTMRHPWVGEGQQVRDTTLNDRILADLIKAPVISAETASKIHALLTEAVAGTARPPT